MVRTFLAAVSLPYLLSHRPLPVLSNNNEVPSDAQMSVTNNTLNLLAEAQSDTFTADSATWTSGKWNAAWMSGKWGVGFRFPGGRRMENATLCGKGGEYPAAQLLEQLTSGFVSGTGPSWVLLGLSQGASGDSYTSLHPVLTAMDDTTGTRYTPSRDGKADHFDTIVRHIKSHSDLKVIAYFATEGPAKLKHGYQKAYDYIPGEYVACPQVQNKDPGKCTAAMRVWFDAVHGWYGTNDATDPKTMKKVLHEAYAYHIVKPYVHKFAGRVDGYWFDHSNYGNENLLHRAVTLEDPLAALAFRSSKYVNVPLLVKHPGKEDYTAGHPHALSNVPPFHPDNMGMVTSIEETADGYIRKTPWGTSKHQSLGHLFMPASRTTWNEIDSPVGWKEKTAQRWMHRVLAAGGAWTWNVPRKTNEGCVDAGMLDTNHTKFLRRVAAVVVPSVIQRRCVDRAKRFNADHEKKLKKLYFGQIKHCRKLAKKAARKKCSAAKIEKHERRMQDSNLRMNKRIRNCKQSSLRSVSSQPVPPAVQPTVKLQRCKKHTQATHAHSDQKNECTHKEL